MILDVRDLMENETDTETPESDPRFFRERDRVPDSLLRRIRPAASCSLRDATDDTVRLDERPRVFDCDRRDVREFEKPEHSDHIEVPDHVPVLREPLRCCDDLRASHFRISETIQNARDGPTW